VRCDNSSGIVPLFTPSFPLSFPPSPVPPLIHFAWALIGVVTLVHPCIYAGLVVPLVPTSFPPLYPLIPALVQASFVPSLAPSFPPCLDPRSRLISTSFGPSFGPLFGPLLPPCWHLVGTLVQTRFMLSFALVHPGPGCLQLLCTCSTHPCSSSFVLAGSLVTSV